MLRINRQTDYAIRVILALAKHPEGARLSTGEIQREMLIPPATMIRVVAELARAGLVITFAGRDGGLTLPRPVSKITIKDVVEVFEGPILLSACLQSNGEDDCPFQTNCPVRAKWGRIQAVILREMASINFAELAQETIGIPAQMESLI